MLGIAFSEAQRTQRLALKIQQNNASTQNNPKSESSLKAQQLSTSQPDGQPTKPTQPSRRTRRRRRQRKNAATQKNLQNGGNGGTDSKSSNPATGGHHHSQNGSKTHDAPMTKRDMYFSLRCGMVEIATATNSVDTAVGRVTLLNWDNQIVMDELLAVPVPVVDYRTQLTGIMPHESVKARLTLSAARQKVGQCIKGKILIGHGLEVDLGALGLTHPWSDVRDTANYPDYMRQQAYQGSSGTPQQPVLLPRSLDELLQDMPPSLTECIEEAAGPVFEAVGCLNLYKAVRQNWEEQLIQIVQQRERQRESIMTMRNARVSGCGSGGSMSYGAVPAPLRSINENGPMGAPVGHSKMGGVHPQWHQLQRQGVFPHEATPQPLAVSGRGDWGSSALSSSEQTTTVDMYRDDASDASSYFSRSSLGGSSYASESMFSGASSVISRNSRGSGFIPAPTAPHADTANRRSFFSFRRKSPAAVAAPPSPQYVVHSQHSNCSYGSGDKNIWNDSQQFPEQEWMDRNSPQFERMTLGDESVLGPDPVDQAAGCMMPSSHYGGDGAPMTRSLLRAHEAKFQHEEQHLRRNNETQSGWLNPSTMNSVVTIQPRLQNNPQFDLANPTDEQLSEEELMEQRLPSELLQTFDT